MLQLAPQYGTSSTHDFYRVLLGALRETPQEEGEKLLGRLEAVLTEEQREYSSWIENVRARWE